MDIKSEKKSCIELYYRAVSLNFEDIKLDYDDCYYQVDTEKEDIYITGFELVQEKSYKVPDVFEICKVELFDNSKIEEFDYNNISDSKMIITNNLKRVKGNNLISIPSTYAFLCELEYAEFRKVIRVGKYAFKNNKCLKELYLDSAEFIDDEALSWCKALTVLDLRNVKALGDFVFFEDNNLKEIHLSKLESVKSHTFSGFKHSVDIIFHDVDKEDSRIKEIVSEIKKEKNLNIIFM